MKIIPYKGIFPTISESAILFDNVTVIGKVKIADYVNVWYNTIIRADINTIEIGAFTNLQDGCVVHIDSHYPTVIGENVTIGHAAVIHGCTIEKNALIGMSATLLNGCVIGEGAIVAAGALVKENFQVPPRKLIAGVPAKIIRDVSDDEFQSILNSAKHYVQTAKEHKQSYQEG